MLNGVPKCHGALKVTHIMFFSQSVLVLDHFLTIYTTANGQYYCTLLQGKVKLAVCRQQLKLLQHCVILLPDRAAPPL
jgi:hypothetical protein